MEGWKEDLQPRQTPTDVDKRSKPGLPPSEALFGVFLLKLYCAENI